MNTGRSEMPIEEDSPFIYKTPKEDRDSSNSAINPFKKRKDNKPSTFAVNPILDP